MSIARRVIDTGLRYTVRSSEIRLDFGLTRAGSRVHRVRLGGSHSCCGRKLDLFFRTPHDVVAPLCRLCFKPGERQERS